MRLDNAFEVALPVEQAWSLLTDLPRIAPCLPGAQLEDVVDGEYRGGLSAKIGPVNAHYQGTARFLERDEVARRAVIRATGRETKGTGTASATITATLRSADTATRVELSTELAISGGAAEFGRTLLAEASSILISEFARHLENQINGAGSTPDTRNNVDAARTAVPILRRTAVPTVAALLGAALGYRLGCRHPCK